MDASVYAYLILLLGFRWTENIVMMRTGTFKIRFKMQWTTWVLTALFVIIAISPIVEHMHLRTEPGYVSWTLGAIAFVAATMFRAKGHLDLKKGFSPYIERTDSQELVDTAPALYRHLADVRCVSVVPRVESLMDLYWPWFCRPHCKDQGRRTVLVG